MIIPNNRVISKWFKVHVFIYLYGFEPCCSRFAIFEVLRTFFYSFCWMYVSMCARTCICTFLELTKDSSWYKWPAGSFSLPNWTIGCKSFRTTNFRYFLISIVLERSWRSIFSWVDYKRTSFISLYNQMFSFPFFAAPRLLFSEINHFFLPKEIERGNYALSES